PLFSLSLLSIGSSAVPLESGGVSVDCFAPLGLSFFTKSSLFIRGGTIEPVPLVESSHPLSSSEVEQILARL
ncbi:hypothetical protein PFISCL1PPCAC_19248, partial [Pristionchus fissidentatus]